MLYAHTQILNDVGQSYYATSNAPHLEKMLAQVFIPKDSIVDLPGFNYNCDLQAIYTEVIKILNQLNEEK